VFSSFFFFCLPLICFFIQFSIFAKNEIYKNKKSKQRSTDNLNIRNVSFTLKKMLLPNVDSDVIAVPRHIPHELTPMLGDVIDVQTGSVIDKMPVEPEWQSPWMKYTPISDLTEMTRTTFKLSASQDQSKKVAGELVKWPQQSDYAVTLHKYSDIVCKTLDLVAFINQYKDNHVLNTSRRVVVAVYATRRVEGGFRIIAYLPAVLKFRSHNIADVQQSHSQPNADLMARTDMRWIQAEVMAGNRSIERAVKKKRFSTIYLHGLPRHEIDKLQKMAGCALEIFSWAKS
jgi:hypothetical protein